MSRFNKYEVDQFEYDKIKSIQNSNKTKYNEHYYGGRKSLFIYNTMIATCSESANLDIGKLTNGQFISFIANFNRHLYKNFEKNPKLFDLKIEFYGIARKKNYKLWDELKNETYFYNIDLNSAYWQMAYRLGYITKSYYEKYFYFDEYKKVKRYCISFLARENQMVYSNGNIIKCEIGVLRQVYENIRNELYNCIKNSLKGVNNFLEYNIDGVTILVDDIATVKKNFKEMGLVFKITECQKINNEKYLYAGNERVFKNEKLIKYENSNN